jgi:hypothetical protein
MNKLYCRLLRSFLGRNSGQDHAIGMKGGAVWLTVLCPVLAGTFGCGQRDEAVPTLPTLEAREPVQGDGRFSDLGLSCSMSVSGPKVTMSISNQGQSDVRVFAWDTPWDQQSDALNVMASGTGAKARYIGPVLTRIQDETSFVTVPAHGNLQTEYTLSGFYELGEGQEFTIGLQRSTLGVSAQGDPRLLQLAHECGVVKLARHDQSSGENVGSVSEALLSPYPDCTATQKAQIQTVINGAMVAAKAAIAEYDHNNAYTIQRFFGNQSGNPSVCYQRMLAEDELVRCGSVVPLPGEPAPTISPCDGNLGVVQDYFFDEKLYLCPGVWSGPFASVEAHNQQVGVLVHELSHLVDQPAGNIPDFDNPSCVGWPDHKCYGFENVVQLATHCTDCAQRNAENYMFFAMQAFMRPAMVVAMNL